MPERFEGLDVQIWLTHSFEVFNFRLRIWACFAHRSVLLYVRLREAALPGGLPLITRTAPVRNVPFTAEPGFYEPGSLWLYGNVKLLHCHLAHAPRACTCRDLVPMELDRLASETEQLVLDGKILVCGIHSLAHRQSAIVPLRWGSPRVVVFPGGFHHHLGPRLRDEPFEAARLWRYEWDPLTDLAVSLRSPFEKPIRRRDWLLLNELIVQLALGQRKGFNSIFDSLTPMLRKE